MKCVKFYVCHDDGWCRLETKCVLLRHVFELS